MEGGPKGLWVTWSITGDSYSRLFTKDLEGNLARIVT